MDEPVVIPHKLVKITSQNTDWQAFAHCTCGKVFVGNDLSRTIAEDIVLIKFREHATLEAMKPAEEKA